MAKPKSSDDPLLDLCRSLPGVTEDVKWDNDLVFSVGGKMFAVFALPDLEKMSFKVEPTLFPVLTARPASFPRPTWRSTRGSAWSTGRPCPGRSWKSSSASRTRWSRRSSRVTVRQGLGAW